MIKIKKTLQLISAEHKDLLTSNIRDAKKILIITHQNPDGDAIGSSLGLFHALKNYGVNPVVVVPNDFPAFLKWMPASEEILVYERQKEAIKSILEENPFIFYLDFNDINRIGKMKDAVEKSNGFGILVDHHPYPENFANIIISDITASSTAELVFKLVQKVFGNKVIDKSVAECLYAGIMTDTGSFSYNSSRPETYEILSQLLSYGIDKDSIYSMVYDNFSADRMKLLGYCLDQKMVVLPEFGTAYISLTNEEKKSYNFQPGDSEGFVNYPLSVSGIFFSAFFMENGKKVKISFRSKGDFPVNHFASRYFEGGGHRNAAGGESDLPLDKTIERFVGLLKIYYEDFKNGKIVE
jgi:bifunctional oligoribonuclease and PAP phosphatase NrnA